MEKTIFEQMGGTYSRVGDYMLPNLLPPKEKTKPIGIWGQRHLRYLKTHRKITYTNLITSDKLNSYLADIDKQAEQMFSRLVTQMAEHEWVTEKFKAGNQMLWIQKMNNIRSCVVEIVNSDLILQLGISEI